MVKTVTRTLYDRAEKTEKSETITIADGAAAPALPDNCVLIEEQTISEKEVTYIMTPSVFIENAAVLEKE